MDDKQETRAENVGSGVLVDRTAHGGNLAPMKNDEKQWRPSVGGRWGRWQNYLSG